MPDALPTISPLAALVLLVMMASIVGAWIWAILRLAFGYSFLPPNTPRIVPWGAGSVLAAVLSWVALQVAVPTVYFAAFRHHPALPGAPRPELTPGEMMALSAVQNALVLIFVPLVLRATSGAGLRDFGLVRGNLLRQVPRGIVAYPLLAPIVFGVMMVSVLYWGKTNHPLENAIGQDKSPAMVAILVLAGVVLAPASEELIFRGVLLGWLTRLAVGEKRAIVPSSTMEPIEGPTHSADGRHLLETVESDSSDAAADVGFFPETAEHLAQNPYEAPFSPLVTKYETVLADPSERVASLWLANICVSLVFAALHGAVWPTPIPIFFLSLGLGLLYQRTGGILASTTLHMIFNGVSTLLMFLTIGPAPLKDAPRAPAPIPPPARAAAMLEGWGAPTDSGIFCRAGLVLPGRDRSKTAGQVLPDKKMSIRSEDLPVSPESVARPEGCLFLGSPLTHRRSFGTIFFPDDKDDVGSPMEADVPSALENLRPTFDRGMTRSGGGTIRYFGDTPRTSSVRASIDLK